MTRSKYIIVLAIVVLAAAFGAATVVSGGTDAAKQPPCHTETAASSGDATAADHCPKMAQGAGMAGAHGGAMCGQNMDCGGCMSDLTGSAKAAHDAYKQNTAELRKDLATSRSELSTLLKSASPDRAKVTAAVDRVNALQGRLYKETVDMYLQVAPSLPADRKCGMDPVQCTMMMSAQCPMMMQQGSASSMHGKGGMTHKPASSVQSKAEMNHGMMGCGTGPGCGMK